MNTESFWIRKTLRSRHSPHRVATYPGQLAGALLEGHRGSCLSTDSLALSPSSNHKPETVAGVTPLPHSHHRFQKTDGKGSLQEPSSHAVDHRLIPRERIPFCMSNLLITRRIFCFPGLHSWPGCCSETSNRADNSEQIHCSSSCLWWGRRRWPQNTIRKPWRF